MTGAVEVAPAEGEVAVIPEPKPKAPRQLGHRGQLGSWWWNTRPAVPVWELMVGYVDQRRIEQMSNKQLDTLVQVATKSMEMVKTLQSFIRRIESERKRATRTEATS